MPRLVLYSVLVINLLGLVYFLPVYTRQVDNIRQMQVGLGDWLAQHTAAEARLAVNDVGGIAYYSGRNCLDLVGLITPEIAPYLQQGERGVLQFLYEQQPEYLIIFPEWYPHLSALELLFDPVHSVTLEQNLISGGRTMVVYQAHWEHWDQVASQVQTWPK